MENINSSYYRYLRYFLAKDDTTATPYDKYMALSYAVRSQLVDRWIETQKGYHERNERRVYYLSMEYMLGKSLKQNIINLNLEENVSQAAESLGFSLEEAMEQEDDFNLGNGGKARLAACFQESMATLGVAAMGYGLQYDYALFHQEIKNGMQVERPYDWLHRGRPWEIERPQYACKVGFGGTVSFSSVSKTEPQPIWKCADEIVAVPYDVPIVGYRNKTVNTVRFWSSRATEDFFDDYQFHGDYFRACEEKSRCERITKVLFPNEEVLRASELRIKQQYFFISASLQDLLRRYKAHNNTILDLDKKIVIQLNGSRCAIAIAEFMRLLVDIERIPWVDAWELTRKIFAYTSNAVSRDNLERSYRAICRLSTNLTNAISTKSKPNKSEMICDASFRLLKKVKLSASRWRIWRFLARFRSTGYRVNRRTCSKRAFSANFQITCPLPFRT
jgi:starch phosphorylase